MATSTPPIPRVIWQTYKSKDLPAPALACRKTWQDRNPGVPCHLFDDAEIDACMATHFDAATLSVFRSLPLGVMRADMWRYAVLYVFGGVYADIDAVCLRPIEAWLTPGASAVIGLENDTDTCQWAFACAPRHPVVEATLRRIVRLAVAEGGVDTTFEHFVHRHTGPSIWRRGVSEALTGGAEDDLSAAALLARFGEGQPGARTLGVALHPYAFFNTDNVRNLYGSQTFGDGYARWTAQRASMARGLVPLQSHERPADAPPPLLTCSQEEPDAVAGIEGAA